jgi:MFS family permease
VTGRGRGFAVHEALDQVGALAGPLAVAGLLYVFGGDYGPTLGLLAIPGAGVIALLCWLRARVPEPAQYEVVAPRRLKSVDRTPFPRRFWIYSGFSAATMVGFTTFAVLAFHQVSRGIVATGWVPVIYAAAMAADAVAALLTGWAYDRIGGRVLAVLPLLAAAVPVLAFSERLGLVVSGALVWGAAVGIQESTLRAVVADLVAPPRRATAYGVYAALVGTATAAGGALTGFLYGHSLALLVTVVVAIQVVAMAALPWVLMNSDSAGQA